MAIQSGLLLALQWDSEPPIGPGTLADGTDLHTRLLVYLQFLYSSTNGDLTTLTRRYLDAQTSGDATQRMQALIAAAIDATN